MSNLVQKIRDGLYSLFGESEKINNSEEEEELQEIPYSLGLYQDPPDDRDYQIKNVLKSSKPTKSKVDYSDKMSPVKDQGELGACVSFAVAAVLEYQQQQEYLNERKQKSTTHKRDKDHYDLSEQWIYWKAKEIDPWDIKEQGTTIRHGLKVVNKEGVPPEHGGPYVDKNEPVDKPKFGAHAVAKGNKNKNYYRINNMDELKEALIEIGPVIAGVVVFKEFFNPDSEGVVKYPENPDKNYGGHAITLVGFDDDKELVKFKNSWGKDGGVDGYGYLPYKYLEEFMMDCWVTVDDKIMSL